jgi:hypothetical protein
MATTSAADLARSLKGAHFPLSKKELAELARKNGASKDVMETIEGLRDEKFASVAEVEKAFGEESRSQGGASKPRSSESTEAAREGGHHSRGGRSRES